jgi:predicted DCC family thiol-disulfide oxidoreductase YuxK
MSKIAVSFHIIYDGLCNLCVGFVQQLEQIDQGASFDYIPMQDIETLGRFGISAADCQLGMILIDAHQPDLRWQGSEAAEEIARQFPAVAQLITVYRLLPGVQWIGDRFYEQLRDNRYQWFGKRDDVYGSPYAIGCASFKNPD